MLRVSALPMGKSQERARNGARNNVNRCVNMPARQYLGTLEARRRRLDHPVATRRGIPSVQHELAITLLHLLLDSDYVAITALLPSFSWATLTLRAGAGCNHETYEDEDKADENKYQQLRMF